MSSCKYKVSLISAIYGVERYITKFADSVLSQTSDDVQFIFVNDGTRDRSVEILRQLIQEKYSHITDRILIIDQPNMGLPQARKTGLEHAEGEYVLFADSDDWIELNTVERIVDVAKQTDADIIYFDIVKEYGSRRSVKREREYTAATREEWIENIFNYRSFGYTCTKCFKRRLYTENKIYIPKLGMHEDIYIMSQIIFYAKSIVYLPEVLYHYRKDNEGAMTAGDRKSRHLASSENLLDLYDKYRDDIAHSPIRRVADGIVLRAGWHSLIHGRDFFKENDWLADAICRAKVSNNYRTPLLFQVIVKVYVRMMRRKS